MLCYNLYIELFSDQINEIIYQELTETLEDQENYLKMALEGLSAGVYSFEVEEEIKELKKDVKALKRVLKIWET